jgi:hypothetical protein
MHTWYLWSKHDFKTDASALVWPTVAIFLGSETQAFQTTENRAKLLLVIMGLAEICCTKVGGIVAWGGPWFL